MTTSIGSQVRMQWDADWDSQVLRSREAQRAVQQAADRAATVAKAFAPVASGDYQASIGSTTAFEDGAYVGRIGSSDYKALWIERGAHSEDYTTPPQHVLQRGVESATGVKVVPGV